VAIFGYIREVALEKLTSIITGKKAIIMETEQNRVLWGTPPEIYPFWHAGQIVGPAGAGTMVAGHCPDRVFRVADWVVGRKDLRGAVDRHLEIVQPDIFCLSLLTSQFNTGCRIAEYAKIQNRGLKVIMGGYHITGETEKGVEKIEGIDYAWRGMAEFQFARFLDALDKGDEQALYTFPGLSFKEKGSWVHNKSTTRCPVLEADMPFPNPDARLYDKDAFHFHSISSFDVVEGSKGCMKNCSFCCLRSMVKGFHPRPISWVIGYLKILRDRGVEIVFFSDDDPAMDKDQFMELLHAIIAEGLHHDMCFSSMMSTEQMADPEIVQLMRRANWYFVFLGVENILEENLGGWNKSSSKELAQKALENLYDAGILTLAGIIVGNPGDTEKTIRELYRFLRSLPGAHPLSQFPQPYLGTKMREEMLQEDLVDNVDNWDLYNGSICQCKTRSGLMPEDIEAIVLEEHTATTKHAAKYILSSTIMRRNPGHMVKWMRRDLRSFLAHPVKNLGKTWLERAAIERQRRIDVNTFNL